MRLPRSRVDYGGEPVEGPLVSETGTRCRASDWGDECWWQMSAAADRMGDRSWEAATEVRTTEVEIAGLKMKLELPPGVFQPTTCTWMLVEQMGELGGKTVLDLGCGAGPIGIAAALSGAKKVYAVDVMEEACQTTARNAETNRVGDRIEVRRGDLFEPIRDMKFDVVVADVSGMAEKVARISPWYPEPIPAGGPDGTVPTVQMLRRSRTHLETGGRLLFPVLGLACASIILSVAREAYGGSVRKVAERMIPFCKELKEKLALLRRLKDEGIIQYVTKGSRHLWSLAVYRADA